MPRASSKENGRAVRGKQGPGRNSKNKKLCLSPEGEDFLPDEIIVEILSWLPVKWVLRCKCVCKLWHIIIQDRKFIEKHMHRGKSKIAYGEKSDSNGNKEIFRWLSYFDGLVLETNEMNDKHRIRNPATKQVLELPDPEAIRVNMVMCFLTSATDYKLVYIHYKRGTLTDLGIKVLTVGTDLAWRPLDVSLSFDRKREKIFVTSPVGFFYLIKFCETGLGITEIIGLSLEDESFMKIKIPRDFQSGRKQFGPFVWDHKLSLGCIIQEELHVRVLENHKKQKWSDTKIIPLTFMKDYPNMSENLVLNYGSGGLLTISLNSEQRLSYDIESKKVKYFTTAPPGKKVLYPIRPSLVFFPGMHPEENVNKSK